MAYKLTEISGNRDPKREITSDMVERAASVLWCHAQYVGDEWTSRSLARAMLEAAMR